MKGPLVIPSVGAGVAYLVGAAMTFPALYDVATAVPVEAVISRHEVLEKGGTDPDDDASYTPIVTFRFVLDGAQYTADHVRPGITTSYGNRTIAELEIAPFPVGSTVAAFAPARDPARAFLIAEPSMFPPAIMLGAIAFLCFWIIWRIKADPPVEHQPTLMLSFGFPIIFLLAGVGIALPWTLITDGTTFVKAMLWFAALVLAAAPRIMVRIAKSGQLYSPFPDDPTD